jgi:hypothetical protein
MLDPSGDPDPVRPSLSLLITIPAWAESLIGLAATLILTASSLEASES